VSGSGDRLVHVEVPDGQGIQAGDGNVQVNVYRPGSGGQPRTVVAGDVPQEPAAYQPRAGLMESLELVGGTRVSMVFAVTGIRGVGKTQVAAALARRRMAEGWRLVAWVDAGDEASVLAGLAQVAAAAGVGPWGEDARVLAGRVRHWLEADGERRLLVFDNAVDLDVLRPFLPAGGAAQVIVTSSRRSASGLGRPVQVEVFSQQEALAFLAQRTGLDDVPGALELVQELGFLPLGLAQAAALIAREHLSYGTYLGRLRAFPVAGYLGRAEGDAYPYRLAEAIIMSLRAVENRDSSGVCGQLMGLVAVLAETGVSRRVLHLAASTGVLDGERGAADVDAAAGVLADASLLGFTTDDSVVTHRLVMRVARERLAAEGGLRGVLAGAVRMLKGLADGIGEAWRDPGEVRELAGQVSAVVVNVAGHPDALAGEELEMLLRLRLRSVYLLNMLGDSTGLVILAAEPLVSECERLLGADHRDTVTARVNLAYAYRAAGQTAEAIALYERALSDRERVLGIDHPDTLLLRNNLAEAYRAAGRIADVIPLHERTLADRERVLGADHPDTLMSRNNLALAYRAAGRTAEAIALYERTLADFERLLGADHPDALNSRNNLAMAYWTAGRTAEAMSLHQRTLADFERVLGTDHPDTLNSRNNLAEAYQDAGRMAEAIVLHQRTLADFERVLGTDHPDTLTSRNNLAASYQDAGRTAEAIPLLERTLADRERLLGSGHPSTLMSRSNLAVAYQAAGRAPEAIALLERTLADCELLLGINHPSTTVVRENLVELTGRRTQGSGN